MKTYFTFMKESHTLYHKSYTDAIDAALKHSDLKVSDEDRDTHKVAEELTSTLGNVVNRIKPVAIRAAKLAVKKVVKPAAKHVFNVVKHGVLRSILEDPTEMRHSSDSLGNYKALGEYAKTLGPKHIDYHDLMTAASHMAFGNIDHLKKFVHGLDTDVREVVVKHVARRYHQDLGYKVQKEEVNQIDEARPSQRHPLEDHPFHKKTDAELVYIAKDAHAAAEKMKSHNTTAENKYRDQASDSATVRYFRQKNGMPDWYKKKYGHMKEEANQIHEEHMSEKDAEILAQKHVNAAISAKKAGDLKGHAAHAEASNDIRDMILNFLKQRKNNHKVMLLVVCLVEVILPTNSVLERIRA